MDYQAISDLILSERRIHPVAQLIDYYKIFYQALYGPGHIISDERSARCYLDEELRLFTGNEEPLIQDISYIDNDYCRVNLQVIRLKMITFEEYFQSFLRSVTNERHKEDFFSLWAVIAGIIREMSILGVEFSKQYDDLNLWLQREGDYSPRHSEIYRQAYNPHYRLIRKRYTSAFFGK